MSKPATVTLLDQFIPEWDVHEHHRLRIDADVERVMTAVTEVTWAEASLARALSGLVGNKLPADKPLIDTFGGLDGALARASDELVFGAISPMRGDGPAHKNLDAEAFRTFAEPGFSKIAFNFRFADGELTTETRVGLTDPGSRRKFQFYC
ncbi:hypothetical protein [Micromonospora tarensis]|uniref:Uncharacterized protein n=1 Tax=Micromonospora tarensis TaxID=2806100 RepID=A0ABS1YAM5_9ACTN|nr:hypothetical protein [Micromonospora tarensis]MBM0274423.1 hypothetical protein [Micromonospora tarensis]